MTDYLPPDVHDDCEKEAKRFADEIDRLAHQLEVAERTIRQLTRDLYAAELYRRSLQRMGDQAAKEAEFSD